MTWPTRRIFIKRTAAAAGAVAFAAGCRRLQLTESNDISPDAIDRLRAKLKGRLVLPTDPSYENARRVFYWNPATERRPRVIVQCAAEDDALRAVDFARRHELEVAVRAGGHSHLGWGCSNGLVIDLFGMKRIEIDPVRRTARAEAGVLSGRMAQAAGRHGLAPVLGQCPGVGATGVILGGGLGWLSGLHGASCDNLLSARVVAADGRVLTADGERHTGLFWALRGAGANFGVTTSFECRLHPIGPVTGGEIHYSVRDARTVLRLFRELMAFPLRQAGALNVRMAYAWNDPSTGQRLTEWAGESLRLLRPGADERIYANFTDRNLLFHGGLGRSLPGSLTQEKASPMQPPITRANPCLRSPHFRNLRMVVPMIDRQKP